MSSKFDGYRLSKENGLKLLQENEASRKPLDQSAWRGVCAHFEEGVAIAPGLMVFKEGSSLVCATNREIPIREQRAQIRVGEKNAIAQFLWSWLYDRVSIWPENTDTRSPNFGELPLQASANWTEDDDLHEVLERKWSVFRARTVTEIVIDAGTTTAACAKSFLKSKNMPLTTFSPLGKHLTRPSVVTNCIEIASLFSRSKHRSELQLRLIGGMEHRERRSICGDLALQWLKMARGNGTIAISDLSVVGTTGFLAEGQRIMPAFGCDDPLESEIKSELLQSSRFRILVMDSSKTDYPTAIGCFASLSPHEVDLVITDDGKFPRQNEDKSPPGNVGEFAKMAYKLKVPVISVAHPKAFP